MALNALKIQTADLVGKLVAQLSNRPTNSITSGGDNLTAQEVKERYDAYGHLLKDRFNALVDAIVADPSTDTDALANYIKVYLGDPAENDPLSLADALAALVTAIAAKYALPGGGIPAEDLATDVQTSLGKADTAYQKPTGGIPASDLADAVKTILTNALLQSDADMSATGGKLGRRDYSGVMHGATYGASAIDTALVNKGQFEPIKALALGATKAFSVENYSALVTALSDAEKTAYRVGQTIFVGTAEVPDVWIYSVEDSSVSYTYTTDSTLEASLVAGTLQIGYFTLRQMETKTDLSDYAKTDAVSEAIDALIDALVDGVMSVAEADYAESATYAQQADIANQINTDREIEDADTACPPVVFGTVGGNAEVQSGLNKFSELRGHTIKWNQLINPADFPSTRTINGITFTNNGDGTVTLSGTATASAYISIMSAVGKKIVGHKYLLRGCPVGGNASNGYRMFDNGESPYKYDVGDGVIYTAAVADGGGIYISISSGTVISTPITFKPNYFDLTDIYGAGNEPSTVAELVRDFSLPLYGYSARTLLSSKSSSVDFVKRNQCPALDTFFNVLPNTEYEVSGITAGGYLQEFDGNKTLIKTSSEITSTTDITLTAQTVYAKIQATTYTDVLCYIKWETPNLPYVPYSKQTITLPNIELRSAGTAYDVAYQTGGGKRRIGTIDLGSLLWGYNATNEVFYATIPGMKEMYNAYVAKNVLCSVYPTSPNSLSNLNDKSITASYLASPNDVAIKDTDYSSADAFKTAMSGVVLYYELATETDITLEENPGWTEYSEIDNFGTVKFNQDPAQTIPVPQAYFVRYTVNLVEFLDSLYVHCGGDVSKLALVE